MKSLRLLFVLALICLSAIIVKVSAARFYNINDIYGISLRETFSVCKDGNGFVWAAAKTSVVRMTDSDCRVYHLPLNSYDITTCGICYRYGHLACYTNNGMFFLYDESLDRFKLLFDMRKLLHNASVYVNNVEIDGNGSLWIASFNGLFRFSDGVLKRITRSGAGYVTMKDSHNVIITDAKGVCMMNVNTLRRTSFRSVAQGTALVGQRLCYDSRSDQLWMASATLGLMRYDLRHRVWSKVEMRGFPDRIILSLTLDDDGTVLAGTEGQGAYRIDNAGKRLLNVYREEPGKQSLQGNSVHGIFCDRDRTYFATYSGGLFVLYKHEMFNMPMQDDPGDVLASGKQYVHKIFQDSNNRVWLATNGGLLCREASSTVWREMSTIPKAELDALNEDANGHLWVGSYYSGLYILDKNGAVLRHFVPDHHNAEFHAATILDIFRDSNNDMWIGGNDILYRYRWREQRFCAYPISPVNAFEEYPKGQLLMTNNRGLLSMDMRTGAYRYLITGCLAQDIFVQGGDIVWIATGGSGLIRYHLATHEKRVFTTADGLPSNYINSLLFSDGSLWIGSEGGFGKMNLHTLAFTDYSSAVHSSYLLYNIRTRCRLRSGDTYWGTNSGLLSFTPRTSGHAVAPCSIYIQNITVSGSSLRKIGSMSEGISLNKMKTLTLHHDDNNFMVELIPVGSALGAVKFSSCLEGVDRGWSAPTERRYINYTNLPAGSYTLRIRVLDASAVNQLAERSIMIVVQPAFWNTIWFRCLMLLALMVLSFYIYKTYMKAQKRKYEDEKLRFFTSIAHDLRTSITLINAPLKELGSAHELSEKSRYFLRIVTGQSEKLLAVANRLLDFQKADTSKERLVCTDVDISLLVKQRVAAFATLAQQHHIILSTTFPEAACVTTVDRQKIEEVVDNLLSNAIKYSDDGGTVLVCLSADSRKWSLMVKDNGMGMTPETRRRLFHEFYRGENATNQKILGSGIGLMLVKKYVEMHGGTVSVESKLNEGSSFAVVIPCRNPVATSSPEDSAPTANEIHSSTADTMSSAECPETENVPDSSAKSSFNNTEEETHSDKVCNHTEDGVSEDSAAVASDREGIHTIVVAEDNDDMRGFIAQSLQDNYEVWTARDGSEAWLLVQKQLPDLVISDVMMPKMNGMMLCRLIKSTFETSHIPVILLTALAGKESEMEGLGLGADDYITKPFDCDILRQRMASLIHNRAAIREKAERYSSRQEPTAAPILSNELNDQFVKQAVKVVKVNMSNVDFDRDSFAAMLCVSSSLLYKKLKLLTGQSPTDFIRTIRMNYANELLLTHRYTVTEVSDKCGFSGINYFSRAFKKYYGKLPTEV